MTQDWGTSMDAFLAWREANPRSEEDKAYWRDHARRNARRATDALGPATHDGMYGSGNVRSEVEYVHGTGMDPSFGLYPNDRVQ